jgi:hypothetical protein
LAWFVSFVSIVLFCHLIVSSHIDVVTWSATNAHAAHKRQRRPTSEEGTRAVKKDADFSKYRHTDAGTHERQVSDDDHTTWSRW